MEGVCTQVNLNPLLSFHLRCLTLAAILEDVRFALLRSGTV